MATMGSLNPSSKTSKPVSLVIFEGGRVQGVLESQMQMVRQGMVLDLVERAREAGFTHILVVTSYPELALGLEDAAVEVVLDKEIERPFHFGQRLRDVVEGCQLEKVLYMGGAAAPLISSGELQYMREILEQNEEVFLTNNYYSADIVGFTPAAALGRLNLPAIDNALPMVLSNEGGLRYVPLQRTLGLNFDVDTPTDVLIMAVHPALGSHTRAAVENLDWDFSRAEAIKELLGNPMGELVIYGRVGPNLFQYLDANTRCRLRLYSEERSMKALGRDARGEVKALMGRLVEELGFAAFFRFLAELAGGAVLDTRVLFEHFHWELSAADRFASDLGRLELISHGPLREFTRAALEAPIPVLLGGHSLVAGGLWAMIDAGLKDLPA
jgi:CTP:molybdopterin cytidylyltransferase MocA